MTLRLFDKPLIEIMADPFAERTDEVDAIDGFVDFFPVEHATLELFDSNPQEILVGLLDLEPPSLIASQPLFFHLFATRVVEEFTTILLAGTSPGSLFSPWHVFSLYLVG